MSQTYHNPLANQDYSLMANAIRALTIDTIENAKSGHPGMPLGMADFITILYSEFFNFNPADSKWQNRDRLILSAGHGSILLYSVFYLCGYNDININDLKKFRQLNAKTAGHPEYGLLNGIETTTGPLGQGIANAVGMAISAKKNQNQVKDLDHKIYSICGDGCLMEGISQEAISLAGHLGLNNLILIFDNNNVSIDGNINITISDDYKLRFKSCNWNIIEICGHNYSEIREALSAAQSATKPVVIFTKTIIGYGSTKNQGSNKSHGSPLGSIEAINTKKHLNINYSPFEIPEYILNLWRTRHKRCKAKYNHWLNYSDDTYKKIFTHVKIDNLNNHLQKTKETYHLSYNKESTRISSQNIINILTQNYPYFIGGSADLTDSTKTSPNSLKAITKYDYSGNFIHYGVREHAMVAIMNGISLYGTHLPYGGTYLAFSDYCKAAIRLAAQMKQQIFLIFSHDSIGVGEDGSTHQPIEQLASFRAMPNILVFRPANKIETLECWQIALAHKNTPSIFALTRQDISNNYKKSNINKNYSKQGAYNIKTSKNAEVVIFATGSEVEISLKAAYELDQISISTRVVSIPCWEIFEEQPKSYQKKIMGNEKIRVAVEAASSFGWEKFIGTNGIFIGMNSFGASGKANELFDFFGITAKNIIKQILLKKEQYEN